MSRLARGSSLAARPALAAIRAYQRWISPHKGFGCALRLATGADSCSAYGYRVIERFGLRQGLGLLQRRLALCTHVHRSAMRPPPPIPPWRRRQQGHCDLPDCDFSICDLCDVLECGCDLFDWRRERRDHDALARRLRQQSIGTTASGRPRPGRSPRTAPDPATPAAESSPAAED